MELKADILDMKSRSMRDNLLFFGIPEDGKETDSQCSEKVLILIETKCGIKISSHNIVLQRAHRIGRFNNTKKIPIDL